MLVQLTIRRTGTESAFDSPVDGIRIMALLPGTWHTDLAHAPGGIVIRARVEGDSLGRVREEALQALAHPEVSHCELVACRSLTDDRPGKEGNP